MCIQFYKPFYRFSWLKTSSLDGPSIHVLNMCIFTIMGKNFEPYNGKVEASSEHIEKMQVIVYPVMVVCTN